VSLHEKPLPVQVAAWSIVAPSVDIQIPGTSNARRHSFNIAVREFNDKQNRRVADLGPSGDESDARRKRALEDESRAVQGQITVA
jgi:hypothetical protein